MERSPSPVGSTSTPFINNVSYRSRQRNAPSKGPVILTTGVAKKPRSSNPLKKLLQQKQKADSYAFLDELSDTDDDLDLLGIDLLAVASSEGEMDVDSAGARVAQLLGSKDGKAVGKILTHDRNHHIKNVKVVGIEFFTHEHKSAPPATRSTYIAKLEGEDFNDAVFNVFKNAVHVNGIVLLPAILSTPDHVVSQMPPKSRRSWMQVFLHVSSLTISVITLDGWSIKVLPPVYHVFHR